MRKLIPNRRLANCVKEVKTLRPFLFGTFEKKVSEELAESDDESGGESEESAPKAKMASLNRHESRALLANLESEKLAHSMKNSPIERSYELPDRPKVQANFDQETYDPVFLLPGLDIFGLMLVVR